MKRKVGVSDISKMKMLIIMYLLQNTYKGKENNKFFCSKEISFLRSTFIGNCNVKDSQCMVFYMYVHILNSYDHVTDLSDMFCDFETISECQK